METSHERLKNSICCALFAALTAVGAFIRIPFGVISFTLQTFFCCAFGCAAGKEIWDNGPGALCNPGADRHSDFHQGRRPTICPGTQLWLSIGLYSGRLCHRMDCAERCLHILATHGGRLRGAGDHLLRGLGLYVLYPELLSVYAHHHLDGILDGSHYFFAL